MAAFINQALLLINYAFAYCTKKQIWPQPHCCQIMGRGILGWQSHCEFQTRKASLLHVVIFLKHKTKIIQQHESISFLLRERDIKFFCLNPRSPEALRCRVGLEMFAILSALKAVSASHGTPLRQINVCANIGLPGSGPPSSNCVPGCFFGNKGDP